MLKVARILDIKSNKIIGKLYKENGSLIARPEVGGDSDLPVAYYYNNRLYDKIELAMELDVIDDLIIDSKLLSDIEKIFDNKYEIITVN